MARRTALPGGALDKLMKEAASPRQGARDARNGTPAKPSRPKLGTPARARRAKRTVSRSASTRPTIQLSDPVVRYAASRGLMLPAGPIESVKLAVQIALDVRELARRERIGMITVLARALAGYLQEHGG